jgi:pyruvate dehydrogenase E2 component (dihydrolipoamide acetyltransferase)/2-oxoglutarate dehydrogenase E2 component (dihydrolipoamide succinyltransferase)
MPKLAMAMQEGQVIEWLAAEGDWVEKGQPVMTVETEKVTYECEAPASGFVHHAIELDTVVPVLTPVAWLAATEEELEQLRHSEPPVLAQEDGGPTTAPPPPEDSPRRQAKVKISPVAKKLAAQHGLNLARIEGTGPGGRIVRKDIDRALATSDVAAPSVASTSLPASTATPDRRIRATIPLRGMRKTIAEHMQRSLAESAQMSLMGEVDMTEMIRLRQTLLRKEAEVGVRITYTDLFVLVLVKAVQHVPLVNSSLVGDEIRIWEDINVGVAVALDRGEYESGLIVPVVHQAGTKSLVEIARTVRELSDRAREGKLGPEDVSGGTITLSNAGAFYPGWAVTTPILNQAEAMIVQPGGIFDRPVARDGQLVIRPIMSLSLTYDHRILDGVPVAKFYTRLQELLEQPAWMHL